MGRLSGYSANVTPGPGEALAATVIPSPSALEPSRWRAFSRLGLAWGRSGVPWSYGFGCAALILLYSGAAHLSYALRFAGPVSSLVWLPVGVGIAFLYMRGLRFWPAVVIGDLTANQYSTLPLGSAVGQTCGNLVEILLAAWLLQRLVSPVRPLESIRSVLGLFGALAAGTLVSAVIGPVSLWIGGAISGGSLPRVSASWWLGDFCGAAIVVPTVLAWWRAGPSHWDRSRAVEAALLGVLLLTLNIAAVAGRGPVSYIAFPALMWAALRFGRRGATTAFIISAAFMIWGTTHYLGAFDVGSINRGLLETQLYVAVTAVATLLVAALAREREQLAAAALASRKRIVVAADEERRRIERNLHDGAQARLVALSAHLSLAAAEAQRSPDTGASSLAAGKEEVLLAIDELRDLVRGIHPAALRKYGFARAVEEVAARSSTPIELPVLPAGRFDETAEATAYYVVLEAVTNAQRHAGATIIRVRADLVGATLEVEIADDGIGGAVEQSSLGLQGLRDRVEATGGSFTLSSDVDRGTVVQARIPLRVVAAAS
jgi:signal transduction histidine kinase